MSPLPSHSSHSTKRSTSDTSFDEAWALLVAEGEGTGARVRATALRVAVRRIAITRVGPLVRGCANALDAHAIVVAFHEGAFLGVVQSDTADRSSLRHGLHLQTICIYSHQMYLVGPIVNLLLTVGYRIIPAVVPWMAAQDAQKPQPTSSEYAKALDRLIGVFGAGWMKTAVALGNNFSEKAVIERKRFLIETDQAKKQRSQHILELTLVGKYVNAQKFFCCTL